MDSSPEPSLQIERMNEHTVEAVAALERACFSMPGTLDALVAELSNPIAVYYTARQGGEVVGYIGMQHIVDEGFVGNIAVDAAHRRKGIATALLNVLFAYAKKHDIHSLMLEVRASNDAAVALYKNFGFEQDGLRKAYYTLPTEDAILMTRRL